MMLQWHRLTDGTHYEVQGIIEDALSVVWTERWQEYGDAQIVIPKTHDVQVGDLVTIPERAMATEVVGRLETEKRVELRCKDALSILDRRIVYPTVSNDGLVSTFVTKLVTPFIGGTLPRTIRPLRLGDITAITGSAAIQRTYSHVGEVMTSLGQTYGFNPEMRLAQGLLYLGASANSTVRVWGVGRYLSGYKEDTDKSAYGSMAYVGAQIDASGSRTVKMYPTAHPPSNLNRFETFVDRRDLPTNGMDRATLESTYGTITLIRGASITTLTEGRGSTEKVVDFSFSSRVDIGNLTVDVRIDSLRTATDNADIVAQMIEAASPGRTYTGSHSSTDGGWRMLVDTIYVLDDSLLDSATFDLQDASVQTVLGEIGKEALDGMNVSTIFEAYTEGQTPYVDYNLGDSVMIYKGGGESRSGVIREIVESWDEKGYHATPSLTVL